MSDANTKDPVCGMNINSASARFKHQLGSKEYAFCSQQCLDKFKAKPDAYKAA